LLVLDWSKVECASDKTKSDVTPLSNHFDRGDELATELLVDAVSLFSCPEFLWISGHLLGSFVVCLE
jgi:hypothetical protein